jgi:hypothetical protein
MGTHEDRSRKRKRKTSSCGLLRGQRSKTTGRSTLPRRSSASLGSLEVSQRISHFRRKMAHPVMVDGAEETRNTVSRRAARNDSFEGRISFIPARWVDRGFTRNGL